MIPRSRILTFEGIDMFVGLLHSGPIWGHSTALFSGPDIESDLGILTYVNTAGTCGQEHFE
eukprot:2744873-Amphidinium_carterae.1